MTEYGTIKIPRDEYERHNQRRQDLGLSWADYIDGQASDARGDADVKVDVDTDALVDELTARLPARIADELR